MNSNSEAQNKQNLESRVVPFNKSYPVDFRLWDENGSSVVYIDDNHSHNLDLEILNTSQRTIELIKDKKWLGNYQPSAAHHHFELIFRPGVLAQPKAIRLKDSENKNWSIAYQQQSDGTISLYFLHKNESMTINTNNKIFLTLQGIRASSQGGHRNTRVELKYQNLRYQGDEASFSGNRLNSLTILNHSGKKEVPLHAGFVRGDRVLNDGNPNELHLRVANVTLKEVYLKSMDSSAPPKFILSFETGETSSYGFCRICCCQR